MDVIKLPADLRQSLPKEVLNDMEEEAQPWKAAPARSKWHREKHQAQTRPVQARHMTWQRVSPLAAQAQMQTRHQRQWALRCHAHCPQRSAHWQCFLKLSRAGARMGIHSMLAATAHLRH